MPRRRLPQDPIQELLALIKANGGRYPRPSYVPTWTEDLLASGARYELTPALFNLHARLLMEQALTGWLPTDVHQLAGRLGMPPDELALQLVHLEPWYTDLGDGRMLNSRMAGECVLTIKLLAARTATGRLGGKASARARSGDHPGGADGAAPGGPPDCTVGSTDGAPTVAPKGEPKGAAKGEPTQNPETPTNVGVSSPGNLGGGATHPKRKPKGPHTDDDDLAAQLCQLIVQAGVRPTAKPSSTSVAGFGRLRRRLMREGATHAQAVERIRASLSWVFTQSPDPATGYSHRRNLLSGDSWASKVSKGDGYRFDRVEAESRRGQAPATPSSKGQEDAARERRETDACLEVLRALAAADGLEEAQAALGDSRPAHRALERLGGLEGFLERLRAAQSGGDHEAKLALTNRWRDAWRSNGAPASRLPGAEHLAEKLAPPGDPV